MANILLVFCPQQHRDVADIKAQLDGSGAHSIETESNVESGLARLGKRAFDLIVVGAELADDDDSAVAADRGVAFCKRAREVSTAPMLLLLPVVTTQVQLACAQIRGAPVQPLSDKNMIGNFAVNALREPEATRAEQQPELDIAVFADEEGWRYKMNGVRFEFQCEGTLKVSRSASMLWSDFKYGASDWYQDFTRIGSSIRTCFCEDNPEFKLNLDVAHAEARAQIPPGTPGQTLKLLRRVTFVVSKSYYPLLLEAIFHPVYPEPWLAEARLTRRIKVGRSERGDLLQGSAGSRRALLICADTSGRYYGRNDERLDLDELATLQEECKLVEQMLTRRDPRTQQRLFDPGNVVCIGRDEDVTGKSLLARLRGETWDLIHFAGHTYWRKPEGPNDPGHGYLFVGPRGEPEALDFYEVVSYLQRARFLYLSSCESGNSSFAAEAAAAGIHTMVGYRWRVKDQKAKLQALLFYRNLLRHQSVDTAFVNVRRRAYRHYGGRDNSWASAMLVTPHQ